MPELGPLIAQPLDRGQVDELDEINDRKDKLLSRIYMRKLEALFQQVFASIMRGLRGLKGLMEAEGAEGAERYPFILNPQRASLNSVRPGRRKTLSLDVSSAGNSSPNP